MCGVAALFAYHYAAPPIRREELARMSDHMIRRGPDGAGAWFSDDGRAGLAHRRLAIIDLDQRANQPMTSACGRFRISYNGEIYNYRVLRKELESLGVNLRTESDTEVLLELFARQGPSILPRLRGMFAFVLHDDESKHMWLVRDPYGIKPLYYADDGWCLRVASQVKTLLASGGVSRQPEPAGRVGFLLWGSVPDPFTCYQSIRAVPAGSYIRVDAIGPSAAVHFQTLNGCFRAEEPISRHESVEIMARDAIRDSLRDHLVSDVPVGAFLSGGIDSGAVVGMMSAHQNQSVLATTILFEGFRNGPYDEVSLARSLADRYGARHIVRMVDDAEIERDMPFFLDSMDQPSIDGINVWFAAKACAEQNLRVALSGIGGDELFGGYPSFSSLPRWHQWARLTRPIPGFGRAMRVISEPILSLTGRVPKRAAGFFELAGTWAGAYLLRRGLFMPWELSSLIGDDESMAGLERLAPHRRVSEVLRPDPGSDMARVSLLESSLYLRNQLLRDCDWAAMAHSLEVRTPLVDIELLRALGPFLRRPHSPLKKGMLASCPAMHLPDSILHRPKTGFATPTAHDKWSLSNRKISRRKAEVAGANPARHLALWLLESQYAA